MSQSTITTVSITDHAQWGQARQWFRGEIISGKILTMGEKLMKKIIATVASTAAFTAALTLGAATAGAHTAGPCGNDGPGNSGYATHHIVPNAKAGALGNGGHKPGAHRGFSVCL
jgi:hypothetical protein